MKRDNGQGNGDGGRYFVVQLRGEAAQARIQVEFDLMVRRLQQAGVDFEALAVLGIVEDKDTGCLVRNHGCSTNEQFGAALKKRGWEALRLAAKDCGRGELGEPEAVVGRVQ